MVFLPLFSSLFLSRGSEPRRGGATCLRRRPLNRRRADRARASMRSCGTESQKTHTWAISRIGAFFLQELELYVASAYWCVGLAIAN